MNLSIHLPDPLLKALDQYASDSSTSRSKVVREAVDQYLRQRSKSAWPESLLQWMQTPTDNPPIASGWPDFDAIRAEANANMTKRSASNPI